MHPALVSKEQRRSLALSGPTSGPVKQMISILADYNFDPMKAKEGRSIWEKISLRKHFFCGAGQIKWPGF